MFASEGYRQATSAFARGDQVQQVKLLLVAALRLWLCATDEERVLRRWQREGAPVRQETLARVTEAARRAAVDLNYTRQLLFEAEAEAETSAE